MHQIQIFNYISPDQDKKNKLSTIEIDGEIWFVASDIAKVLGYKNAPDAIIRHCKPRGIVKHDIPTSSGIQKMTLINEPNVYRLISKSQLPSAETFEAWLFEEVIPSIRKKGYYGNIDRTQPPNFYLRYKANYNKVDRKYFSVINELFITLNPEFEKVGYQIPDKSKDGTAIYPDISVGRLFADYLRETNSIFSESFKTYKHSFPNDRPPVEARMYPIEAIPEFRKFVYNRWIPYNATNYFKSRDPLALDYLPKLLSHA